jgi:HAD superfamily hydrolase (TIGR01490 family)
VNRRAVLKSSFAQFVYLLQGADEESMDKMRDYLAVLCAGWPVQQVQDIVAETLHELIDPLVYAEAVQLFEEHRAAGRDVVIVSSSGEEVVGPIGDMLGVDHVVATRMVVEDGKYTGAIAFYAYGEGKAVAMRELAEERGYDLSDCYAYSDSFTDLPMLELVGHPTAVNPDKPLKRTAVERGWPVREFRRPVRMRDRMPSIPAPPGPPAAYAGVAVAAGALGLAWWAGPPPLTRPHVTQITPGSCARLRAAYNGLTDHRPRADVDPLHGGPCARARHPRATSRERHVERFHRLPGRTHRNQYDGHTCTPCSPDPHAWRRRPSSEGRRLRVRGRRLRPRPRWIASQTATPSRARAPPPSRCARATPRRPAARRRCSRAARRRSRTRRAGRARRGRPRAR